MDILGRAQITQAKSKWDSAVYLRHLERGESFGEATLQAFVFIFNKIDSFSIFVLVFSEETRPFNVVADDPNGVTCLVLDRQSYREMIADELSRLKRDETIRYARKK